MKNFIIAFMMAMITGTVLASFIGVSPVAGISTTVGVSAGYSIVQAYAPNRTEGHAQAIVFKELFTAELINKFRHEQTWIADVPSHNEWVGNNAIRLNEIGADPDVLIDNQIYPISTSGREDSGIIISLHKYETTNTKVPKNELYAVPYDKLGSVSRQHRERIEEVSGDHGSYICSPFEDTAVTPVLQTTGPDDGSGRKRLLSKDIAALQNKYNLLKIPRQGRILRLCPEHVLDLLLEDKAFEKQYMNHTIGAIAPNYYGFKIYEEFYNPVYNSSMERKAFGAISETTDQNSSIAVFTPRTAKARGTVDMFYRDATTDPEFRSHVMGFELWNLVIPKVQLGMGAIVSDKS